ncbi:hypothetical protein GCM10010452_74650 [Crossiella cryophila]|uniref:sensor histidine kinase n=1 Tax=Crossiella cryophila TaxID=43355 RepID=UPI0031E82E1E
MGARHRSITAPQDEQTETEQSRFATLATSLVRPRSIRAKLARILTVSLAIVLALLVIIVLDVVQRQRQATQTAESVSLALGVQDLIHELQRERGMTNGLLGGDTRYRSQVDTQRGRTDEVLNRLNRLNSDAALSGAGELRTALGRLAGVAQVRGTVDGGRAERDTTFNYYTDNITTLAHTELGLSESADPVIRRGVLALTALGEAKEATAQERGFLNGVFAANKFRQQQEYVHFSEIRASKQNALSAFGRAATQDQRSRLDEAMRSGPATEAAGYEGIAISGSAGALPSKVDAQSWWNTMTRLVDDMRAVQQAVGDDIRAVAAGLQNNATWQLLGYLALAALAIAVEVALVIGATRSILGPLAGLVTEADDMARHRLPEAVDRVQAATGEGGGEHAEPPPPVRIPERASTEIRSVAAALDRVQNTAFSLASEQAVLRRNTSESLANLGRRNQNLVRRQLGFISEFEQEELNPTTLANLFELDHLATRMRRNAESLLVLVGESNPRRWAAPLPITDVIRAALSEVEDYRRVVLRRMDDVHLTGSVVTEVAHLLAELIENGLSFSPPDLEVEIYGRRVGSQYLLAIIDHGVGMPSDALARANARLRGEENFLVAPTRFLGHYVVGRLAQRLSATVELADSPATGITSRITLPGSLIADPSAKLPPTPEPKAQASQAAVAAGSRANVPVQQSRQSSAPVSGPPPAATRQSGAAPAPHHPTPAPAGTSTTWPESPATFGRTAATPAPHPPATDPASPPAAPASAPASALPPAAPAPAAAPASASAPAPTVASAPANSATPAAPTGAPVRPEATPGSRTKNGLLKRVPKNRAPARPEPASRPRPAEDRPPVDTRDPDDVRSMLSSFRNGHRRGQRGLFEAELSAEPGARTSPAHPRPSEEDPR